MADRDLQVILNSGDITGINIGGTATDDKVLKKSESDTAYLSFDNSPTSLASTTVQAALVELANIGYTHMELITPYTVGQVLSTTPIKISAFDTKDHEINGAVTGVIDTSEAVPAHSFTINKDGVYDVKGTVIAEFASANDVTIELYKNSVATGYKVNLQGRGAGKAVQFTYLGDLNFVATDVLELYAYADAASVNTVITGSSMVVERKALG